MHWISKIKVSYFVPHIHWARISISQKAITITRFNPHHSACSTNYFTLPFEQTVEAFRDKNTKTYQEWSGPVSIAELNIFDDVLYYFKSYNSISSDRIINSLTGIVCSTGLLYFEWVTIMGDE